MLLEDCIVTVIKSDIRLCFIIIYSFFIRYLFAFAYDIGLTVNNFVLIIYMIIKFLYISIN